MCQQEFKHSNIQLLSMYLLYHFSIRYYVKFFLKVALSNFGVFLSNDSTVEANWIFNRIMTYNKTAIDKSKYIKKHQTTPNQRTYLSKNCWLQLCRPSRSWRKHQHTHAPKDTYSLLAAHYFNTFINKLLLL